MSPFFMGASIRGLKSVAPPVYPQDVQITIDIPDDLASHYIPAGRDASRAVLEDALVQAYREERISGHQLMEALDIPTRYELDGFLKARQVWIEYSDEELERERLVSRTLRESRATQTVGNSAI